MVKAPSQHGLDRKYRSWRKGKSAKANKQGSLKHQLRGQERLLAKLQKQPGAPADRVQELQSNIASLKDQIGQKADQAQQRGHAKKSHGTRFLERQRLTRLERAARKDQDAQELKRIAMDQIYVAHYPLHRAYRPLFRNGKRWLQHSVSRAQLRHSICQDLKQKKIPTVPWIAKDRYDRVPASWSVKEETELFNYPSGDKKPKGKKETSADERFAFQPNHDALLQAAQELESKSKQEPQEDKEKAGDSSSSSDSDSSEDGSDQEEDNNKKQPAQKPNSQPVEEKKDDDSSSSSSNSSSDSDSNNGNTKKSSQNKNPPQGEEDSDSSSDSDEDGKEAHNTKQPAAQKQPPQEDSDSDSSSSSDSDSDQEDKAHTKQPAAQKRKPVEQDNDSSDDEFLVPAHDNDLIAFDEQVEYLPAENPAKGDKSQGWATQQQRPGKYQKKRTRRKTSG